MYVKNEVYNSEIFGWSHKSGEKNLLKTYTHRCEPAKGGRGNLASQPYRVANFVGKANLFFRIAKRYPTTFVMTKRLCRFVLLSANAEDRK